jgi:hypothetical protein
MKKMIFNLVMIIACIFGSTIQGESLKYTIHDTGTLETEYSFPSCINNLNTIVGCVKTDGNWNDFVYDQHTGFQVLPYENSLKQNPLINNLGQIVGVHWKLQKHWFSTDTRSKHIYLREADGSSKDISLPSNWNIQTLESWKTPLVWDNHEVQVISLNDQGKILVANTKKDGVVIELALWENGKFEQIDSEALTYAYKMNNQGAILGRQLVKKAGADTAIPMLVLYDPIHQTTEQIIQDVNILHVDLNDQGQAVLVRSSPNIIEGYLWDRENGLVSLDEFCPMYINNQGQIVGGRLTVNEFTLNFWNHGEETNLNEAVAVGKIDSPWHTIQGVTGLNDYGCICGVGKISGEKKHAFLLIPAEPFPLSEN